MALLLAGVALGAPVKAAAVGLSPGEEPRPTGTIRGTIAAPGTEVAPRILVVTFAAAPAKGPGTQDSRRGQVECPVEGRRFTCLLPAGLWDLRLRPPGFVPQYRWGAEVRAGETLDLAALQFVRGAVVVGWISTVAGRLDPARCRIELRPAQDLGVGPDVAARRRVMTEAAHPDGRGFFHLDGVPRGLYTLAVSQPGFAPSEVPHLTVPEGGETDAGRIELVRPIDVEFRVSPPQDVLGRPWRVELHRGSAEAHLAAPVTRRTDEDGAFTIPALGPGHYALRVFDTAGSAVGEREFDLPTRESPVEVELSFVPIEGRLTLGERPLAGDLWFGGRGGLVSVRMIADEKGRFVGLLPRPGVWRVDVEAEARRIRRYRLSVKVPEAAAGGRARVAVALPIAELRGTVVDPEGAPVARAQVWLRDASNTAEEDTEADGSFHFRALEPGDVQLSAERGDLASEQVAVRVAEDREAPEVRLQLRRRETLRGVLRSDAGPLAGVAILVFPVQGGEFVMTPVGQASSGVDGRFEIGVPAGASAVEIVAFPPGSALLVEQLPLPFPGSVVLRPAPEGGALRLRFASFTAEDGIARPRVAVFHDGREVDEFVLRTWAVRNNVPNADPRELFVPQMPAGSYQVCRLPGALPTTELRKLAAGVSAASDWKCVDGQLFSSTELALNVPEE